MQKEEENLQESTLPETDEQPAAPDAESAQDEEYSDDPVISGGEAGKILLLCVLVAVGGMAAAFGIFYLSGYFS